jgi:hypothetical protein
MSARIASLGAVVAIALWGTASGAQPVPSCGVDSLQSDIPRHLVLVGHCAGVPDPTFSFLLTLRDAAGAPLAGLPVAIAIEPGANIAVCSTQPAASRVEVVAGWIRIWNTTDYSGRAMFRIVGARPAPSLSPGAFVHYCGANRHLVHVAAVDLDGGGVSCTDLSCWLEDSGLTLEPIPRHLPEADYDGDGLVTAADLSTWLAVAGGGLSMESCGTLPGG